MNLQFLHGEPDTFAGKSDRSVLKRWLCHFQAIVWPWASSLISLNLTLLICKTEIIMIYVI